MPFTMLLGMKGHGKSLTGMRKLYDELRNGRRRIVTNMALELGELRDYLLQTGGPKLADQIKRITILDQKQVRKFWLIRGDGWTLLDITKEQHKQHLYPDLETLYRWVKEKDRGEERTPLELLTLAQVKPLVESGQVEVSSVSEQGGVFYLIDEVQMFFRARNWQDIPDSLPFYNEQERKLGDDAVFTSQVVDQVEKGLRNLCEEFYVLRNLGRKSKWGFRLPKMFVWMQYSEPPGGLGVRADNIGRFKLDVAGLARCYRTAGGVGINGQGLVADTQSEKPGLHWSVFVGIFLGLMVLFMMVPGAAGKVFSWVLLRSDKKPASVQPVVKTNAVAVPSQLEIEARNLVGRPVFTPFNSAAVATNKSLDIDEQEKGTNRLRIVGWVLHPSQSMVMLSDGRRLVLGEDPELTKIEKNCVWVEGRRISWR